jgi:DNA-binding MarR family transcriptional regulator
MTQVRIQGKFYPLQHEEWLELSKKLTHSELRILYYLRTIEPFGENFKEASTKAIADDLEVSQRTVQRAVLRLAELELIDLEITKFKFRVRSQHATPTSLGDTHVATASPMSPSRHPCRGKDTHVATASPMSPSKPESFAVTESYNSKTNKTYSDYLDNTNRSGCEKSFVEKPADEIFAKYEEQLKYFGITRIIWPQSEPEPIENPRIKPIFRALREVPPQRAERALAAFLKWAKTSQNVKDIYKALETAILRGWEV